jgi:hypothetical protein
MNGRSSLSVVAQLPVLILVGLIRVTLQQGATLGDLTTGDYLKCMQVAAMIRERNKFQNENGQTVLGMTAASCMDCDPNPTIDGEGTPIVTQGGGARNPPPPQLDWDQKLVNSCPDGCQVFISAEA